MYGLVAPIAQFTAATYHSIERDSVNIYTVSNMLNIEYTTNRYHNLLHDGRELNNEIVQVRSRT